MGLETRAAVRAQEQLASRRHRLLTHVLCLSAAASTAAANPAPEPGTPPPPRRCNFGRLMGSLNSLIQGTVTGSGADGRVTAQDLGDNFVACQSVAEQMDSQTCGDEGAPQCINACYETTCAIDGSPPLSATDCNCLKSCYEAAATPTCDGTNGLTDNVMTNWLGASCPRAADLCFAKDDCANEVASDTGVSQMCFAAVSALARDTEVVSMPTECDACDPAVSSAETVCPACEAAIGSAFVACEGLCPANADCMNELHTDTGVTQGCYAAIDAVIQHPSVSLPAACDGCDPVVSSAETVCPACESAVRAALTSC